MSRALLASSMVLGSRRVDTAAYGAALAVAVPRGMRSTRVADADEDALTLAVAAARRVLGDAVGKVGEVFLVGDFDVSASAVLCEALDLPEVAVSRFDGTVEGATDACLVAFDRAGPEATLLIAAYDGRDGPARPHAAAGAVAMLIGTGAGVRLLDEAHVRRHRAEPEHVAHLVAEVAARLGGDGNDLVALAERVPLEGQALLPARMARALHALPTAEVGDLGPVSPLAALVEAARAAGPDRHVVWLVPVDHGVVGARWRVEDATRLASVQDALQAPAAAVEGVDAARLRSAWADGDRRLAQGAYVSPQLYLSQAPARYRLEGQRCGACAALVFPPRECCPACASRVLEPHRFSGRGSVYARTHIARGGAPTEFAPLQESLGPYTVAVVALEEGPRVAAMLAGGQRDVAIGTPVRMVLRLLYVQEGLRRYGFKAVPEDA